VIEYTFLAPGFFRLGWRTLNALHHLGLVESQSARANLVERNLPPLCEELNLSA
jgi:hypothetical protein